MGEPGSGPTFENANNMEADMQNAYRNRYARGAHDMLSDLSPQEVDTQIKGISNGFDSAHILSSISSLSKYARAFDNPEALLNYIRNEAAKFLNDQGDQNHGSWKDVRRVNEMLGGTPMTNVAYLLNEMVMEQYKEIHGHIPQTEEEIKAFEEAKERGKTIKVS